MRAIAPLCSAGAFARRLAREYDADPASADSHHYGRLAGFTNQKPKHTTK
ncbi:DNA-primase RepB domain-containing protein, partial [Aeromonas caviae]